MTPRQPLRNHHHLISLQSSYHHSSPPAPTFEEVLRPDNTTTAMYPSRRPHLAIANHDTDDITFEECSETTTREIDYFDDDNIDLSSVASLALINPSECSPSRNVHHHSSNSAAATQDDTDDDPLSLTKRELLCSPSSSLTTILTSEIQQSTRRIALLAIDLQNDFLGDHDENFYFNSPSYKQRGGFDVQQHPFAERRLPLLSRIEQLARQVQERQGVICFVQSVYGTPHCRHRPRKNIDISSASTDSVNSATTLTTTMIKMTTSTTKSTSSNDDNLVAESRIDDASFISSFRSHLPQKEQHLQHQLDRHPHEQNHQQQSHCCQVGTRGGEFHPEALALLQRIRDREDEERAPVWIVQKQWYSAFLETVLHCQLQRLGVTDLVVTGVTTNHSVAATIRSAHHLGYKIHLSQDGTAQLDPRLQHETCQQLEKYCQTILLPGQSVSNVFDRIPETNGRNTLQHSHQGISSEMVVDHNLMLMTDSETNPQIRNTSISASALSSSSSGSSPVNDTNKHQQSNHNDSLIFDGCVRLTGLGTGDTILIPDWLDIEHANQVLEDIYHHESFEDHAEPEWERGIISQLQQSVQEQTGYPVISGHVHWERDTSRQERFHKKYNVSVATAILGRGRILRFVPRQPSSKLAPQLIYVHHNSLLVVGPETKRSYRYAWYYHHQRRDTSIDPKLPRVSLTFGYQIEKEMTTVDGPEHTQSLVRSMTTDANSMASSDDTTKLHNSRHPHNSLKTKSTRYGSDEPQFDAIQILKFIPSTNDIAEASSIRPPGVESEFSGLAIAETEPCRCGESRTDSPTAANVPSVEVTQPGRMDLMEKGAAGGGVVTNDSLIPEFSDANDVMGLIPPRYNQIVSGYTSGSMGLASSQQGSPTLLPTRRAQLSFESALEALCCVNSMPVPNTTQKVKARESSSSREVPGPNQHAENVEAIIETPSNQTLGAQNNSCTISPGECRVKSLPPDEHEELAEMHAGHDMEVETMAKNSIPSKKIDLAKEEIEDRADTPDVCDVCAATLNVRSAQQHADMALTIDSTESPNDEDHEVASLEKSELSLVRSPVQEKVVGSHHIPNTTNELLSTDNIARRCSQAPSERQRTLLVDPSGYERSSVTNLTVELEGERSPTGHGPRELDTSKITCRNSFKFMNAAGILSERSGVVEERDDSILSVDTTKEKVMIGKEDIAGPFAGVNVKAKPDGIDSATHQKPNVVTPLPDGVTHKLLNVVIPQNYEQVRSAHHHVDMALIIDSTESPNAEDHEVASLEKSELSLMRSPVQEKVVGSHHIPDTMDELASTEDIGCRCTQAPMTNFELNGRCASDDHCCGGGLFGEGSKATEPHSVEVMIRCSNMVVEFAAVKAGEVSGLPGVSHVTSSVKGTQLKRRAVSYDNPHFTYSPVSMTLLCDSAELLTEEKLTIEDEKCKTMPGTIESLESTATMTERDFESPSGDPSSYGLVSVEINANEVADKRLPIICREVVPSSFSCLAEEIFFDSLTEDLHECSRDDHIKGANTQCFSQVKKCWRVEKLTIPDCSLAEIVRFPSQIACIGNSMLKYAYLKMCATCDIQNLHFRYKAALRYFRQEYVTAKKLNVCRPQSVLPRWYSREVIQLVRDYFLFSVMKGWLTETLPLRTESVMKDDCLLPQLISCYRYFWGNRLPLLETAKKWWESSEVPRSESMVHDGRILIVLGTSFLTILAASIAAQPAYPTRTAIKSVWEAVAVSGRFCWNKYIENDGSKAPKLN